MILHASWRTTVVAKQSGQYPGFYYILLIYQIYEGIEKMILKTDHKNQYICLFLFPILPLLPPFVTPANQVVCSNFIKSVFPTKLAELPWTFIHSTHISWHLQNMRKLKSKGKKKQGREGNGWINEYWNFFFF